MMFRPTVSLLVLVSASFGCATAEPQTSYCESLCDWAVECHAADREVDSDALRATCLAATEGADPSCAEAAVGLGTLESKATTECTDAIDAARGAGECAAFTGSYEEMATEIAPTECALQGPAAQETFDAARLSTAEGNDEMCERFAVTFCEATDGCVRAELGATAETVIDSVGVAPYDRCMEKVDSNTQACLTEEQYAPEESITDPNVSRQSARECLADFDEVTCDQLLGGELPPLCAAALEDPTAYSAALLEVVTEYIPVEGG